MNPGRKSPWIIIAFKEMLGLSVGEYKKSQATKMLNF
jgi:hypothetical protein